MLKAIFLSLLFFSQCLFHGTEMGLSAQTVVSGSQECKHYVYADQISLCEEGILIPLSEKDLIVQNLSHDQNGFYYLDDGVYWICRNCGARNSLDNQVCYRCGES